ncbi:MAG: protein phosphatase CheZ [Desulfovibrio sp.]|jgi:chemotaxis protein CheZ|nr:protein phosphatase CheZ [Desulfovibrio sp.]
MTAREEILENIVTRISEQVAEYARQTVAGTVRQELSAYLAQTQSESSFYRSLNEEMRLGLKSIYQEISSASPAAGEQIPVHTQQLFSEATQQIEAIMRTTFEAADSILESVENLLRQQKETGNLLAALNVGPRDRRKLARLEALNHDQESSLTGILTSLSFQDLTGQRLKKAVEAISTIRETVFDLYMSTGLMLKTHEETPGKDISVMAEESRRKIQEIKNSELKGPTSGANQEYVDDLLASLGL